VANEVLEFLTSRQGRDDFVSWPFTKYMLCTLPAQLTVLLEFFVSRSKQGGGVHSSLHDKILL
jgi:hypothetical protein